MDWFKPILIDVPSKVKPVHHKVSDEQIKAVLTELRKAHRLRLELKNYTQAAIAKRHGLHERTIDKIVRKTVGNEQREFKPARRSVHPEPLQSGSSRPTEDR